MTTAAYHGQNIPRTAENRGLNRISVKGALVLHLELKVMLLFDIKKSAF